MLPADVLYSYAEEKDDGTPAEDSDLCALVEFHNEEIPLQRFRTKMEADFGSNVQVSFAKVSENIPNSTMIPLPLTWR